MALTSKQRTCDIIEGFKKQFRSELWSNIGFRFLPRDVMSAIKGHFLIAS